MIINAGSDKEGMRLVISKSEYRVKIEETDREVMIVATPIEEEVLDAKYSEMDELR